MLKRLRSTIVIMSCLTIVAIATVDAKPSLKATKTPAKRSVANESIEATRPPEKPNADESVDPNIGEDPNLAHNPNSTEADICLTNCNVSYSNRPNKFNSFQDVVHGIEKDIYSLPADPSNPIWSQFPAIMAYSQDPKTIHAIKLGLKNKEPGFTGSCWRYSKFFLNDAQNEPVPYDEKSSPYQKPKIGPQALVPKLLKTTDAKESIKELEGEGLTNLLDDSRYRDLIKSPKDAPKGALLVYRHESNENHAGHIEIKTDWGEKGTYVSDFARNDGHDGMTGRVLIGVLIRPGGNP